MKVFYFTATGNSLMVVKRIGGNLISIPQVINENNLVYEDDAIGIVFPTYCCNIPRIVREFLSKVTLKSDYLFAIATYGNGMGTGGDGALLLELKNIALTNNLKFDYLNSILMVDNFLDTFNIEKEISKIPSKNIEENLNKIVDDIKNKKTYTKDIGLGGKIMTAMCKPLVKRQDKGTICKKFVIDDNCIRCGTCKKVCPRNNIEIKDKPQFKTNCEGCYACIHTCPKKAIHIKTEKNNARWRNQGVTLNEIIESNNQK